MKMIITDIEYKNIRKISAFKMSFLNNQDICYKNNFIMMGNGTGKTTTINLIRGLLDGSAEKWSPDEVISFKPLNNESITEGIFSITVNFDEYTYKYFLQLDYKKGIASISCTTSLQGGYERRRSFPEIIENLFTPEFVNRFVFDGEQAQKSLDTDSNEAEDTIKYLYRLNELDNIMASNQRILSEIQKLEEKRGTDQSIKGLRTKKYKHECRIKEMEEEVQELEKKIGAAERNQSIIEDRLKEIEKKFGRLSEEKRELVTKCQGLSANIEFTIVQIIDKMRNPYLLSPMLCQRMIELGDSMTKLKLPKTISKDFFVDLSHETHCVCGNEIGEIERNSILVNAEKYLGSDQQIVLNTIKGALLNCAYEPELDILFEQLSQQEVDYQKFSGNLSDVNQKLQDAGGEESKKLQLEKDKIQRDIGKWSERKESILSKDESNPRLSEENNLDKAYKAKEGLERQIAAATRTNKALKKKEIVDEIVNDIKMLATEQIKTKIINKTNEKLKRVISDDIIQIESIDKCIKLSGKGGASEGQTLSIAYCFLGTMFEDSELLFPFIIDSPAGKMDFNKRKAIASILPTLFNQLIAFVTSAEVEQFADMFYDMPDTQFITVIAPLGSDKVEVHYGKDYFDSYQREHREEEKNVNSL